MTWNVSWLNTTAIWIVAGVFAISASIHSLWNIVQHLRFYNDPKKQKWIVRVLLIIPLYAIVSWLGIKYKHEALYMSVVRDCYEAFVIYCFMMLIVELMGGEYECLQKFKSGETNENGEVVGHRVVHHPCPVNFFYSPMKQDKEFLVFCKQMTLQFVVQKPVMASISLIFISMDDYDDPTYQTILLFIYNTSYTAALYGLFLFYLATRYDLADFHPVAKFFAVKSVVFMTYWQQLAVAILPFSEPDEMNNFVLCIEMAFFAFLHYKAFPYWEFEGEGSKGIVDTVMNIGQVVQVRDIVNDGVDVFIGHKKRDDSMDAPMLDKYTEYDVMTGMVRKNTDTRIVVPLSNYGPAGQQNTYTGASPPSPTYQAASPPGITPPNISKNATGELQYDSIDVPTPSVKKANSDPDGLKQQRSLSSNDALLVSET